MACFNIKTNISSTEIKIKQLSDHAIFIMVIAILVRWHINLYCYSTLVAPGHNEVSKGYPSQCSLVVPW